MVSFVGISVEAVVSRHKIDNYLAYILTNFTRILYSDFCNIVSLLRHSNSCEGRCNRSCY